MKKFLTTLLAILIIFIFMMNVASAVIANLQYWNANDSRIAHWDGNPKFTIRPVVNCPSDFEGNALTGFNAWNLAGIPVYYQLYSGDILVYGGPYAEIKVIYPSFSNTETGVTCIEATSMNDYYTTPSGNKAGYTMNFAKVYINTDIANEKSYLHEAGHSLG